MPLTDEQVARATGMNIDAVRRKREEADMKAKALRTQPTGSSGYVGERQVQPEYEYSPTAGPPRLQKQIQDATR